MLCFLVFVFSILMLGLFIYVWVQNYKRHNSHEFENALHLQEMSRTLRKERVEQLLMVIQSKSNFPHSLISASHTCW